MIDTQKESKIHLYKEIKGTLYLSDRFSGNKRRMKKAKNRKHQHERTHSGLEISQNKICGEECDSCKF